MNKYSVKEVLEGLSKSWIRVNPDGTIRERPNFLCLLDYIDRILENYDKIKWYQKIFRTKFYREVIHEINRVYSFLHENTTVFNKHEIQSIQVRMADMQEILGYYNGF